MAHVSQEGALRPRRRFGLAMGLAQPVLGLPALVDLDLKRLVGPVHQVLVPLRDVGADLGPCVEGARSDDALFQALAQARRCGPADQACRSKVTKVSLWNWAGRPGRVGAISPKE